MRSSGQPDLKRRASHPHNGSRIWLPELVELFASHLDANEVSCSLRLVNKATAALFRGNSKFTTVHLSHPVPPHAFARQWGSPTAMRPLTGDQRRKLLRLTAASGTIPNLEVAMASVGIDLTTRITKSGVHYSDSHMHMGYKMPVLQAAAVKGHLGMCEWLLERGFSVDGVTTAEAAEAGQRDVCKLFLARGVPWSLDFVRRAALRGHADLLNWLLRRRPERGLEPTDSLACLGTAACIDLLRSAATGFDLATLQSLYRRAFGDPAAASHGPEGDVTDVAQGEAETRVLLLLAAAAGSRTPDWQAKVEWLESLLPSDSELPVSAGAKAAACGDAAVRLQWLWERGYPFDSSATTAAVALGDVRALQYLLSEDVDLGAHRWLVHAAAEGGHVEVLQLLHARGCSIDAYYVKMQAARRGHLPMLVWAAKALGAEFSDPWLMRDAARAGDVEPLAWLLEHGASWCPECLGALAESGSELALEWAVAHGCPMPAHGGPYIRAADRRDLNMLRCLGRLGCPWGPRGRVFKESLSWNQSPLPVLRCLADLSCPIDWVAARRYVGCRGSVRKGHVRKDVRDWIVEQRLLEKEAQQQQRQCAARPKPAPQHMARQQRPAPPPTPTPEQKRQARDERAERRERKRQAQ